MWRFRTCTATQQLKMCHVIPTWTNCHFANILKYILMNSKLLYFDYVPQVSCWGPIWQELSIGPSYGLGSNRLHITEPLPVNYTQFHKKLYHMPLIKNIKLYFVLLTADDAIGYPWCHQMETFSASLALCVGNSPVTVEFPTQRPVMWSFDVFFDLCLNKQLSKQSWGWWFETPSFSLWCHCNVHNITNFQGHIRRKFFATSNFRYFQNFEMFNIVPIWHQKWKDHMQIMDQNIFHVTSLITAWQQSVFYIHV